MPSTDILRDRWQMYTSSKLPCAALYFTYRRGNNLTNIPQLYTRQLLTLSRGPPDTAYLKLGTRYLWYFSGLLVL